DSFEPPAPEKWHWRQNCVAEEALAPFPTWAAGLYGAARKKNDGNAPEVKPAIGFEALAVALNMVCGVWQVVHTTYALSELYVPLVGRESTAHPAPARAPITTGRP